MKVKIIESENTKFGKEEAYKIIGDFIRIQMDVPNALPRMIEAEKKNKSAS